MATHGTMLKRTTTRCLTCGNECPGEVWKVQVPGSSREIVTLRHLCPEHGEDTNLLSSDAQFYWLAQGDPANACCTPAAGTGVGTLGGNARAASGKPEVLASCVTLIEIVDSCDLTCPTCFADSPLGKQGQHLKFRPLEEIKRQLDAVIARKGPIEMLQLSGGEPSLHPQLLELVEWIGQHQGIEYAFLNTNGVRFARDRKFLEAFGKVFPRGKMLLYLQFDGPQEAGQVELRGIDLRQVREQAIANCASIGLPVILVMTVTRANLPYVYKTVEFGLKHRNVRAVNFQPAFMSGRSPAQWSLLRETPMTTADVLRSLFAGSNGFLSVKDFTPLPCGDPNCHTIGCLLRPEGQELMSMGNFIDVSNMQGFLADKIHYELPALAACGCDNSELAELLKQYALSEDDVFFLSIKPFMDARTWDKDRIDRCCTHVIDPKDGALRSFCEYYSARH